MNSPNDVRHWHETAGHLAHGHSGDPDRLISYAPTLEQLHFAHADTHLVLAVMGRRPPDGHVHPAAIETGWPTAYESSHRPFLPSASAVADPATWPLPHPTGIRHHLSRLSLTDTSVVWALIARQFIRPEDLAALADDHFAARAGARHTRPRGPGHGRRYCTSDVKPISRQVRGR
jgi:hypothetical protein